MAAAADPAHVAASPLRAAACEIAVYGLPLIEFAATRGRMMRAGQPANEFRHVRALTTVKTQRVTAPNNDTLYSTAWLDLRRGPVRLTIPATGRRYLSVALMDAFTNNFTVLRGADEAREVLVVGPGAAAPPGAVQAPTPWVWALARLLVDGEADLPVANTLQDGLLAEGPPGEAPVMAAPRTAAWPEVFLGLQQLVLEAGVPDVDRPLFARCAALGLAPGGGFDPARISPAQGEEIAAGLAEALSLAKASDASGQTIDGWVWPRPNIGDFGEDYLYRAQIALSGLAALPQSEALYLHPVGPDGAADLDASKDWRVRLPGGGPPNDGFWSLTAYEVTPEGQSFFFDNPIGRHAVGDRTPGLVRGENGDVEIVVSRRQPATATNWLPAPTSGRPLLLNFRCFRPGPEVLSHKYRLPPVERLSP